MASLLDCKDEEWLEAEAGLTIARRLPAGKERIKALKLAGTRRWLISEKLFESEDEHFL